MSYKTKSIFEITYPTIAAYLLPEGIHFQTGTENVLDVHLYSTQELTAADSARLQVEVETLAGFFGCGAFTVHKSTYKVPPAPEGEHHETDDR